MSVTHGGADFILTVPEGVQGGDVIEVDLPAAPEPPVTVVVPEGCYAGDEFSVELADGRSFNIGVPDGSGPGDEIEVQVPPSSRGVSRRASRVSGEEASRAGGSRRVSRDNVRAGASRRASTEQPSPQQLVGRRCQLCGLVAKALLNGRKGLVQSYDAERERLVLTIDAMAPDVSVRIENVTELPDDDEAEADDDEPPEAPPAGVHYVGDTVLVERSDGRTSLATVVEYDEAFETYTLEIGSRGLLKYGVEESYIAPYQMCDVWAGPSQRNRDGQWEGFYVGRRVRVPKMLANSDDDDKNGAIAGYDERSGFYTVELDSGLVRRTVLFNQIKVCFQIRETGEAMAGAVTQIN